MLPPLKPFTTFGENFTTQELSSSLSDDIDYQLDQRTISEEMEITQDDTDEKDSNQYYYDESKYGVEYTEEEEISVIQDTNDSEIVLEDNIVSDINENHMDEITETIDSGVTTEIIENEFKQENELVNTTQLNFENIQNLDGIVNEKEMNIKDEDLAEITEVFTDLVFLDSEEQEVTTKMESPESYTEDDLEGASDYLENQYSAHESPHYGSFSEMISSKDMSKIIEYVFDYDMEDYYSILDKISQTTDELEANKFVEEYCQNNHIELSAMEVDTFKSFISEYFSQTYS